MHIGDADSPSSSDETDRFRTRILDGLAAAGALAGVEHGEAFKLISPL
jgi:hypothetical protein